MDSPGRRFPDDAVVQVPAGFSDDPYTLYADSPGGLRRLCREALALHPAAGAADLDVVDEQISHETEHAEAARALGCAVRFTFSMIPQPGGWQARPGIQWISRAPLSRLAVASIHAAPSRLSQADLRSLRAAGYQDADDLARRIRESNRAGNSPLPVPCSAAVRPGRRPGTGLGSRDYCRQLIRKLGTAP